MKKIGNDFFAMMRVQDTVTNLIDGSNTVGQIVRRTSLEKRSDVKEAVLALLKLYEDLGLISEV